MPKSKFIDPKDVLKPSKITFKDIPVNAYQKKISDEKSTYTKDEFLRMFHDMATLREFESMLYAIKVKGEYEGFKFSYPGPAHLSMGQEAASVGQAYLLEEDDLTFGSHRSHSEVLARGLVSIHKLSEDKLDSIMRTYEDGQTFSVIEREHPNGHVKDLAIDFLLYGTLAEIFAKKTGFHKGMGGSMHVFFQPFGIYPNNAIVGGSAPIATGAALFKKVNNKNGVVIANIGDGSLGCGVVYESLNFAAMDQFTELWDKKGGLPIIFNVFNNGYGMGGQTRGETMAYDFVARLGAGISPSQLHTERVDGFNVLAVIDAYKRKLDIIKKGLGPVFLDVVTYRFSGHSPSDAMSYRSKEEIDAWEAIDPLITFRKDVVEADIAEEKDFDEILKVVKERMYRLFLVAADIEKSPYLDLNEDPYYVESLMFSNQKVESFDTSRRSEVYYLMKKILE